MRLIDSHTHLDDAQFNEDRAAVIERAREVLKLHERSEHAVTEELAKPEVQGPVQIRLFEPVGYGIAGRIRGVNLDQLRPIEALQLLAELQKELGRE